MTQQTSQDPYANIPSSQVTPPQNFCATYSGGTSLLRELNPKQHLMDTMAELEGKVWSERLQKYVVVDGISPLMNKEGRDVFFHIATSVINAIVTMSNFTNDYTKIHNLVLMQVRRVSIQFHLHYKDYGINRKTKINIITDKIMILALSCYYKAIGAGDRKAATSNISETINTLNKLGLEDNEQNKKKGGLARLFGG